MARWLGFLFAALVLFAGCAEAPDPGNPIVFCSLLEGGSGLTDTPTERDLSDLAGVAPPDIRDTITALQARARDFDDLRSEQPPDLEALFKARFDPAADVERAELDAYAVTSCGLAVERPPATRWNSWVRQRHANEPWIASSTVQFEVIEDRISAVTMIFAEAPEPIEVVEQACQAGADFLVSESAQGGRVAVLIGAVAVLDHLTSDPECRLP